MPVVDEKGVTRTGARSVGTGRQGRTCSTDIACPLSNCA